MQQQQKRTITIGEMFISRRQYLIYDEMVMRGRPYAYEMSKIFIDDIARDYGRRLSWNSNDKLAYEIFDEEAEAKDIARFATMIAAGYHENGIARPDYTTGLAKAISESVHN